MKHILMISYLHINMQFEMVFQNQVTFSHYQFILQLIVGLKFHQNI